MNKLNQDQYQKHLAEIRKQELSDIKTVLSSVSGRRFVSRIIGKCKTFESVFNSDPLLMSKLAGKQEIGHFIRTEIIEADENLLQKIIKEAKARESK